MLEKRELHAEEDENVVAVVCEPLFWHHFVEEGARPLVKVEARSDLFKSEKMRMNTFETAQRVKPLSGVAGPLENDSQSSTTSRKDSI